MSKKIYGRPVATPINPRNLVPDVSEDINKALEEAKASGAFKGEPGYTPVKGKDYFDGEPGDDGFSPTVSVSKSGKVTTVSITDKNGTKTETINDGADGYTPVKGKDYFDGEPGTSVTVASVSESTEDGGSNVVTFSNGKILTIKNGTKGASIKGEPGKTAYQYAKEAGFVGTEEEFSELLAGNSINTWGAKGDGTTDDTTAFANALSNSRVVYVPGGTYKLSDTLVIRENCCLELSQDTVLKFTQTSGNCIEMRGSATLRGNHATIIVPYALTGNVISMDTTQDGTNHNSIPPSLAAGSHMSKRQRFVYDINILKPDSSGLCKSTDGKCNGTAIYMSAEGTASIRWMWAITMSGIRIAGGFSYGIRAANFDKAGDYADNAWNHDMRIEAVIENCEIGMALENCNGAHLAVTIQPHATESGVKYCKHGIYLNDSRFVDTIGSRVWDWNENTTMWSAGGQYQHIAMIGNCRGLVLDDFLCSESSTDIRDLIYTDTPANFDTMAVLQEAGGKGVRVEEGYIKYFTDVLATATDGSGNVFEGKGYVKSGYNINSDGSMSANQYYGCTGFIPVKPGDTVYVHGIVLGAGDGSSNFSLYNSSFAKVVNINSANSQFQAGNNYYYHYTALEDGFKVVVAPNNDPTSTAYLRFSYLSNMVKDTPMVAVNEEIQFLSANFLSDDIKVKAANVLGLSVIKGEEGFSPIVDISKSGKVTTLAITDKNGTKTAKINDGTDGNPGTSVTVKSVSESTADGGTNVVTFSDGTTLNVKNGKTGASVKGDDGVSPIVSVSNSGKVTTISITDKTGTKSTTISDGEDGKDGLDATPVTPLFVNTIAECTDTTKPYVLPDGYIYAYLLTKTESSKKPNFTNLMEGAGAYVKDGYRYSQSSAAFKEYAAGTSVVFPYKAAAGTHVIRIRGGIVSSAYSSSFYMGDTNQAFPHTRNQTVKTDSNGDVVYTTTSSTEVNGYLCICIEGVTDLDNIIVTLNEEITYTITEGGVSYKWANTRHAFVPADYEDRIIEVENDVTAQAKKISSLESKVENINADASITAAYNRIKNWQYPIHEDAPVFLLETNKPALTASDMTTAGIYAKYDALMAANSHYIKRVNCGMASDGTTPIYAYHFKQPDPHYLHNGVTQWSEKKPVILVCSGVHPYEFTGEHCMFHAMEEITNNPKLMDLRRNLHFIIFPMLNPTAFTDTQYKMRNPDGVQVHHNFEVDHGKNGAVQGDRYYGGATPLSIPETQYFNAVMEEYKDDLVLVMSCHNNELDERHGTGVIWCSCATHFTCNLGFRFADKMSLAWREKYGADVFDAGIRWANDFVLAQYANPTHPDFQWMFDIITPEAQPEWDYLIGRSNMSGSGGTEYLQGVKYGIHGVNVEVCPRCMILDRNYDLQNTSNAITMGTETYINYFRTFMAVYDPKNKKDYAPNLPWNA